MNTSRVAGVGCFYTRLTRIILSSSLLLSLSCSSGGATGGIDASTDGSLAIDANGTRNDGNDTPYRHTITIDGSDDFVPGERFSTTSQSFVAAITWDDTSVFVGYVGPDIDYATADASTKWLHVYFDAAAGGSTTGETYNTQTPAFPTGFEADFYLRWKVDGSLTELKMWDGDSWEYVKDVVAERAGTFFEVAVLLSDLGSPQKLSVVSLMLNEKDLAEAFYAGLYEGSFTDGYHASLNVGNYLSADFALAAQPNSALNKR